MALGGGYLRRLTKLCQCQFVLEYFVETGDHSSSLKKLSQISHIVFTNDLALFQPGDEVIRAHPVLVGLKRFECFEMGSDLELEGFRSDRGHERVLELFVRRSYIAKIGREQTMNEGISLRLI